MKNLELLPVTQEAKQAIQKTDQNYRRFQKISVDILEVDGNTVTARIEQFDKPGDEVLTAKELIAKGKEVFSHAQNLEIRWRPLPYTGTGMDAVSPKWVRSMMKKNGLRQSDLVDALSVDKFVISKLLSGEYEFTRWHRSAFWYYFKTLNT